jgi:hypothetical protein
VQTVRRVITYLLLFVMVVIAAIGLTGLLERALDLRSAIANGDTFGLAQSLAFALIAGPLAAILWWLTWRDSASARDRASVAWPVYLTVTSTVALLTFAIALLTWGSSLVGGDWLPSSLATAIVWGLVWLWHYWMWRHPAKGPTRLRGVAPAIASLVGLTLLTGGLVFALMALIDSAIRTFGPGVVGGAAPWESVLQSLVWAVGGGLLWWWHWFRAGVREQRTGFSSVLLVYITGFAAFALFAVGVVLVLYVVLRLLVPSSEPLVQILDPLAYGVSSAAFGALVLSYHTRIVASRTPEVRSATRLVTSGTALAIAASGVGVTVNALLGSLGTELVGADFSDLLLGGLSLLVVGGALWWAAWRPGLASSAARTSTPGRRVYLVVIFGASALVALITLLVIGFQAFSFVLGDASGGSFLDRSRQALGLLAVTVLVAVYHFALWRGDRAATPPTEHVRTIERVTIVATDAEALASAVREATGARVSVLRRADAVAREADAAAVVAALDGVTGGHVLVVAGTTTAEVIRLAD